MAEFSVSYAGVEDAYNRLYATYSKIAGISSDIHQTAHKVSGAKSLANKGYYDKIVASARGANTTAERVKTQSVNLLDIGEIYSNAEKRTLSILNDGATTKAGFSKESTAIAGNALASHQSPEWTSIGQSFKESTINSSHDLMNFMDEFKYWRSTKGSAMVKKFVEKYLGEDGLDNVVVREAIKDINGKLGGYEDIITAINNPTNPDALAKGSKAVAKELGLGGFVDMAPRYSKMTDAISDRAADMWERGDKGKAVGYAVSATALTTVQFVGDGLWNTAKYVSDKVVGKGFSMMGGTAKEAGEKGAQRAWKFFGKATGKATSIGLSGPEELFTDFGGWCWSRLDSAFGA